MALTTKNLIEARQAASLILEQLGIEAYLFEIEPKEETWELRVECATTDGWQSLILPVEEKLLLTSQQDAVARNQLREQWRTRFSACKIHEAAGPQVRSKPEGKHFGPA